MEYSKTNKLQLVTGADGFVGRALCTRIEADGWNVRGTVRSAKRVDSLPAEIDIVQIESIGPDTDWSKTLVNVDTVIHLAARAHIIKEKAAEPLIEFRRVNTAGTERLAQTAATAGVRRFIFLSSIGVNGNVTHGQPFTEDDDPHPGTPYAITKLEAEQNLKSIASKSNMEVVVIRSPLVYGPSNPGNFLQLLHGVAKGWPLPFASINNRRSLIYRENLVDAIVACINNPKAAGQTYLVGEGEDISTPELVRRIANALGRPARLFPFPLSLMRVAGRFLGKSAAVESILGSLTVDSGKIRRELQWKAPYTMMEGLQETAAWFLKRGM